MSIAAAFAFSQWPSVVNISIQRSPQIGGVVLICLQRGFNMSCTNPQCAILPLKGGSPIFSRLVDAPAGSTFVHPVLGVCRVIYLPCGHCLCCRRERRMELTLLQCCEASLYDDNWFLTLTYRPLPDGSSPVSLDKRHLSAYLESMRHYCRYNLHKPRENWRAAFERQNRTLGISAGHIKTALQTYQHNSAYLRATLY